MPGRAGSPRRSVGEWSVRAALAAAALLLGIVAITHTFAGTLADRQPDRAHALARSDARTTAAIAEKMSGPEATAADRQRADKLAHDALEHDATVVSAAATLGLNAQVRGETRRAQRWFSYAEQLSRRDLRTQLWMIEWAVGRGDIPGALRHYDIALRTSRLAADLLFPVLESAAAEPAIRAALIRTLATKPIWGEPFVAQAASAGGEPTAIAALFAGLARRGVEVPASARVRVIARLIDAGQFDSAWSYYAALRPGAVRTQSRDPRFAVQLPEPTAFDWQPVNEDGIAVTIQAGGGQSGAVDFSAPPSIGGPLLRQLQVLPPGRYVFDAHVSGVEQPAESRPYWALTCVNGPEIGRAPLPNGDEGGGRMRATFVVPAGCPSQYLSLNAQPSDVVGGTAGQVDRASLRATGVERTS